MRKFMGMRNVKAVITGPYCDIFEYHGNNTLGVFVASVALQKVTPQKLLDFCNALNLNLVNVHRDEKGTLKIWL